jgi:hypothetical protein
MKMKLAKKCLFWILFLPLGMLMFILDFMGWIAESYGNLLEVYERWTFLK